MIQSKSGVTEQPAARKTRKQKGSKLAGWLVQTDPNQALSQNPQCGVALEIQLFYDIWAAENQTKENNSFGLCWAERAQSLPGDFFFLEQIVKSQSAEAGCSPWCRLTSLKKHPGNLRLCASEAKGNEANVSRMFSRDANLKWLE